MATYGTMAVDHEERIDYSKMRKERLEKARAQMVKEGLGALICFDPDNVRYVTSTKLGEWTRDKMCRYSMIIDGKEDPILFEVGAAIPTKQKLCPWLKDIRPAKNGMLNRLPDGVENVAIKELVDILKEYGVADRPIGADVMATSMFLDFVNAGINIVDGAKTMQRAQVIKTKEELACLEISAAMVDGAFYDIAEAIKPGVRENELAGLMRKRLFELGAENVHNVNVISGDRAYPHPHDCTDRIIRPGDFIYLDIVNDFNGYKTCYYRTLCCGYPTDEQMEVYRKAYDWLYDAIKLVKPGVTTAEIVSAWPTAQELGFETEQEAFACEIGHGVGVHHWSRPVFDRINSFDFPETIEEDMHFAMETYCGNEKLGIGARIEEQIIVTADGYKVITKFPCDIPVNCWKYK